MKGKNHKTKAKKKEQKGENKKKKLIKLGKIKNFFNNNFTLSITVCKIP